MKLWQKILTAAVFLASFVVLLILAKTDSLTIDEKVHIPAGYTHVWLGDYSYNAEHPPLANNLSGLFAKLAKPTIPKETAGSVEQWGYGDKFLYENGNNADAIIFWGRFPIILITLGLFYLVFIWAYQLWGFKGGLVGLILAATCPNLIAHGHLATTDLVLAFSFTLNAYFLWKYYKKPSWKNTVFLSLATFLVLASKFSGLLVLPLNLLFLLGFFFKQGRKNFFEKALQAVVSFAISFILLWLLYLFTMRGDLKELYFYYGLNSQFSIVNWLKIFAWPLRKFWDGYSIVRSHNLDGHTSFLNGHFSQFGRWQYFPLAFLYKTPLPALALLILSIIFSLNRKQSFEKLIVILPAAAFFVFSLTGNINIGLRHILPVYPLMFIFISQLALLKNKIWLVIAGVLLALNIIIFSISFPHYISYFNEIVGKNNGYKHLGDSNLDWGQNIKRFKKYLENEKIEKVYFTCYDETTPRYYGINFEKVPADPVKGVIALCGQQYVLTDYDLRDLKWFAKEPPDKVVEGTIFIWERTD